MQRGGRTRPVSAISALIVRVAEAEAAVGALRARHDPSAAEGVPAHVTILVPFKPPPALSDGDLRALEALFAAVPAFDFVLDGVGRFAQTAWLAPLPAAPFVALTQRVAAAFPAWPPYEGRFTEPVPHLTVADGSAEGAGAAAAALRGLAPIRARCEAAELIENASGRWRTLRVFPLGR
jgi:hypothetical protein